MNPLESLFTPRSIAVVGVTENPEKLGHLLLKNIVDAGFGGDLYPVCPTVAEVVGRKTLPSLGEIRSDVDLVLVSVPSHETIAVIKDAARLHPKVLVILSSGFGETGIAGKKLEKEIHAIFAEGGTRVVGPNCRGVYDAHHRLNATFYRDVPRNRGNISFVTQSGSYGALLFDEVRRRGLGISKFASIGNQIDLQHADFIELLGADDRTDAIGLFIEEIKDGSRFTQIAAEVSLKKPIVVFKAGRTQTGGRVAEQHTGSAVGSNEVFEAGARQAGIILARDTEHFFDTLTVLSSFSRNLPVNENVGILTVSGGPSVIAADLCDELGLKLHSLEPATRKTVRGLIPEAGADQNPVDLTPDIDPENYVPCVDAVLGDKNVAGCLAVDVGMDRPEFARAFIEARNRHGKPVVACLAGAPEVTSAFVRSGIPVFPSPERAVWAYQTLVIYRKMLEVQKRKGIMPRVAPAAVPERPATGKTKPKPLQPRVLTGADAKAVLAEAGIPIVPECAVAGIRDAAAFLKDNGYPLTLRIPEGRAARTTAEPVIDGIANRKQFEKALHSLKKKAGKAPLILHRQVTHAPCTLRMVGWRDPVFGCVVRVGLSGVLSEILRDASVRVCPFRRTDAEGMLQEIRAYPLLAHALEGTKQDPARAAEVLVKISDLLLTRPEVVEVTLDPVVFSPGEVLVLSAQATVLR